MTRVGLLFRLPSKLRKRARRSRARLMFILAMTFALLVLPLYMIYKPPTILIRYFQYRWPDVLWYVPTSQKIVALTIDDGPSSYTREILEVLTSNDATATFFILGSQAEKREQILQDIIRAKNELGNHAMFDEPSRSLKDSVLKEQLESVQKMLIEAYFAVGIDPPRKYFRPGSGFFTTRMRETLKLLGYQLVLGSIYPHDPQIPFWRINSNHILSMLQPGRIIICHDRRSWTIPMLRKVLPEAKREGYRVVTLTQLLEEAGS